MRKYISLLAALIVLCLCVDIPVQAEELWSEEYYRAYDTSGRLTADERDALDKDCIAFMRQYQVDLALLGIAPEDYADSSLQECVERYYEACQYGYGPDGDGFLIVYDSEASITEVFCFGDAAERVPQEYLDSVADAAGAYEQDYGVYGVLYGGLLYLSDYLAEHTTAQSETGAPRRAETDSVMPSWYPVDPGQFTFYHDAAAPRVVDDADIFTDAEERRMEARLAGLRQELEKDIVIYTDTSSYGLGHDVCAADFYDFNGYGIGEDYEGVCLFVCMDPADRGWWVACTGPVTMGLYTEDAANQMDDALYEYMADGKYSEGVEDWIENFRTLYVKGIPFAPDWWPDRGTEFQRFHDASAPRIVDDYGALNAAEVQSLTEQAAAISKKYGLDIVVHISYSPGGLPMSTYCEKFYEYNGYGYGENYDGLQLTLFPGSYTLADITGFGKGDEKLSYNNWERLYDRARDHIEPGNYYQGIAEYLRLVDHMERTGRVPRSAVYWTLITALGAALGSAFGGIALGGAKRKMAVPKLRANADAYFVSGSSRITDLGSRFLYSTTTRTYSPRASSSSSGSSRSSSSSGSRSSYSGSYSGSSGRSHSGSGRKF